MEPPGNVFYAPGIRGGHCSLREEGGYVPECLKNLGVANIPDQLEPANRIIDLFACEGGWLFLRNVPEAFDIQILITPELINRDAEEIRDRSDLPISWRFGAVTGARTQHAADRWLIDPCCAGQVGLAEFFQL